MLVDLTLLIEMELEKGDTLLPHLLSQRQKSVTKVSPMIISAENEEEEKKMLTGIMTYLYAGRFYELPSFIQIRLNCVSGWELKWEVRVCD